MNLFGQTRTKVAGRHALIAPDGHVHSDFPDWSGVVANVIISPAMGAEFTQMLLSFGLDGLGTAVFPADENEHLVYVETGSVDLSYEDSSLTLGAGGFLFVPAETFLTLSSSIPSRVTIFRKEYEFTDIGELPPSVHGDATKIVGEPFMGNERAILKTLLPIDPRYDLAVNIFTYEPGATLPFVETHIMEHGLLMLSGQGVYRLEEEYYPVMKGDAIWMAPFCPQWFVAMGDEPASYLYYKNVHRLP
jgi:(S)-ureidoglycine aminohydrolase